MKFREFINADAIVPDMTATDRESAIRELVNALTKAENLTEPSVDEIVAAIVKREQYASTGLGKGVAVPHMKLPNLTKIIATIGRSTKGIDFASLDHLPVFSVVLLLSPLEQPQQHLAAMNVLITNLQKDMFRKFLRQSTTRQAVMELLDEADQGK
jgi:mannitol/fructose-specific phosphotransferase system IIA component (Ntr-type)